jgi:hypothetical protein
MTLLVGIVIGIGSIMFLRWVSLQFDSTSPEIEEEEEDWDWKDC